MPGDSHPDSMELLNKAVMNFTVVLIASIDIKQLNFIASLSRASKPDSGEIAYDSETFSSHLRPQATFC